MNESKLNKIDRAYKLLDDIGTDSQQYLSINDNSMLFFSVTVKGVIAYELVGKRAMCLGNPICKSKHRDRFIIEFLDFCSDKKIKPIFNSVSEEMIEILKKHNFLVLQYGQEAILNLESYSLAGGKKASLRRNFNFVERSKVRIKEYKPNHCRDLQLEKTINELAEEWYSDKEYRMGFTIGSLNFDMPYERRFFYTSDQKGQLLTFLSFLPYNNKSGYCIDVMYRKIDGITGIMEHAIISVAMLMREEGVRELSLGIAPLSGIDIDKSDVNKAEVIMNDIFHNLNCGYNFKNLHRFKKKFEPSYWKKRYLVYHNEISLSSLAMSVTSTKRGDTDIKLIARCKFFLLTHKFRRLRLSLGKTRFQYYY